VLALALLLALVAAVLAVLVAVAARVLRRMDDAPDAPAAPVADLTGRRASEPVLPTLPVGFRYDAVTPGPLQLVDDDGPTTKVCPDCAETVLASARVCKHCRYRFAPPLHGSHAV
jgi:hypothetical protein